VETGVIVARDRARRLQVSQRIQAIRGELSRIAQEWGPHEVACGKPPALQLPFQRQGIEMLGTTLERWAEEFNLPLYCYLIREIRVATLGRASATREELAYAVMTRWGLLGMGKSSHEWCAIAVGDYHLVRRKSPAVLDSHA
jgi:Holliday junction resolvasome RuvABC endonuclease subunit